MTIDEAQRELRRAYVGGGPGAFTSGLIWAGAAFVGQSQSVAQTFAVLFFGGMLIFPISTLICRVIFRRPKESAQNSLGMTALESTIAMIGGFFAAWLLLPFKPELVLPLAAIAVGTHYFSFKTVYGDPLYWALAALLTAVGFVQIYLHALPGGVMPAVAVIELLFGAFLIARNLRSA